MPLDIRAHALKDTALRTVVVPLDAYEDDVSVVVAYDPKRYNADIEAMVTDDFETRPAQTCREIITTFVDTWDLLSGGTAIPVTVEGLRQVALFEIQVPIVNGLMEDMGEMGKSQPADLPPSSSTAKRRKPK